MLLPQPATSSQDSGQFRGPPFWRTRYWSMTHWLLAINIAIYLADVISRELLTQWGALSLPLVTRGQVWRLLSFQFLHADPSHIIFNMLWLYFAGSVVEGYLVGRRFIVFYLLCGIGGGLAFLLMQQMRVPWLERRDYLVGASAGIFGVTVAAACFAPGMRVRFLFVPVAIPIRVMLWVTIGAAFVTVYTGGWNAGGECAHLGGALVGWILSRNLKWINALSRSGRRHRFWRPGDPRENFFRHDA